MMKTLLIVGGVGAAGIIGLLLYRKMKARTALTSGALPARTTVAPSPMVANQQVRQVYQPNFTNTPK